MNKLTKVSLAVVAGLLLSGKALAVCPVCTVAIGAGLGISRLLGISDLISATWIGALLASASLWTINWAAKKGVQFKGFREIVFAVFYVLTIVSLWISKIIGMPGNSVLGADKIMAGIALGTVIFIGTEIIYEITRKKRGKALFPFQKVVMPFAALALASAIFYLIGI
ncbi:MAG: hypothetical protein WC565_01225 [Parcubacteria group bacterium]